jgi:cytochrome d ubiquinol oxidase subunit I
LFSAWFILAANSWMQHPVGYTFNPDSGRAELTDFAAVMFNKVQLVTFPHVILAAYLTAGLFVVAVSGWLFASRRHAEDREVHRAAIRMGAVVALVAGLGVAVSGDFQGKVMTEVQPMKMAAAEGLYETKESCAPFSVLTIGSLDGREEKKAFTIPCLLSFLGTGSTDGRVEGINDLRAEYAETYGSDPGAAYYSAEDYVPVIPVTYWSFRLMIGLGMGAALGSALVLWLTRRGRAPTARWFRTLCIALPLGALAGNSFGWIFTEMGRQPWAVFGLMTTDHAVSPGVSVTEAMISVVTLTVLYGVLAVIEVGLILRTVRSGPDPYVEPAQPGDHPDDDESARPLAFAY